MRCNVLSSETNALLLLQFIPLGAQQKTTMRTSKCAERRFLSPHIRVKKLWNSNFKESMKAFAGKGCFESQEYVRLWLSEIEEGTKVLGDLWRPGKICLPLVWVK